MNVDPHYPVLRRLVWLTVCCFALSLSNLPAVAKPSEWTDAAGNTFKGEPVEVLGPFALFKTGPRNGQRVLMRGLSAEDCARFAVGAADRSTRAAHWSDAKGVITRELPGKVMRAVREDVLEPVDLSQRPEPEVMVLLFASHNDGESWQMLRNFEPTYRRLRAVYPDRLEALFFGVRHDPAQHRRIATAGGQPWLISDFSKQRSMGAITRLAPAEGILMVALSREGVPLVSSRSQTLGEIQKFVDQLTELMRLTDPANPANWKDRQHYAGATRPILFANGQSQPELIGDPLRDDGLRQRGVTRVVATIAVGADGKASTAEVDGAQGVPEALVQPLAQALVRSTTFAPAIANGQPVAGVYHYDRVVASTATAKVADEAWVSGVARLELPLPNWLVLKPVDVPENAFSVVEGVGADGVVMMSAFDASSAKVSKTAQLSAFNSDWFGAAGPGNVSPRVGDRQEVDGEVLTWKALTSDEFGYVDLQSFDRRDYCIGYAWTELQSPQELDAWLGIGSDDGLRIWLNGELVHDRWIRRISKIDDDIVPLKLRAGSNRILIKIQNATGDWSFITRLRLKAP